VTTGSGKVRPGVRTWGISGNSADGRCLDGRTERHDFVGAQPGEEFAQTRQRQEEGREALFHRGRHIDAQGEVEIRGGEAHGLRSRRLHLHTAEDGERRGAGDEFAETGQRRLEIGGAHGDGMGLVIMSG
jgi:hypothetical protein